MDIIAKGVFSGIILAFLIGPVFFTLLQTSIEQGFRSGLFVAIGVSLSDSLYITLTYLGLSNTMGSHDMKIYQGYVGGLVLLGFGLYYLLVKSRKLRKYDPEKITVRSPLRLAMKGFLINGISPMVFLFWIGVVGVATTEWGYTTHAQAILYFSSIVATVFLTDLLKAKLADRLRMALTPQVIRALNFILGIALFLYGSRLLYYADKVY